VAKVTLPSTQTESLSHGAKICGDSKNSKATRNVPRSSDYDVGTDIDSVVGTCFC
jgi:hypothetical protein